MQRKRFADVTLDDKVIDFDVKWRKLRFQADQCNRVGKLVIYKNYESLIFPPPARSKIISLLCR